jgi:hypothetical protein
MSFAAAANGPNQTAVADTAHQDPTKAYVTITVSTPSQAESASNELAGGSVVTITKKVVPVTGLRFDGGEEINVGDTLPPGGVLPDGGTLPTTGTPGQTVLIETCMPRHSTTEYTFKWAPTPPPGHWEVVKKKLVQVASTQCS